MKRLVISYVCIQENGFILGNIIFILRTKPINGINTV
jgi:hypothetical protein